MNETFQSLAGAYTTIDQTKLPERLRESAFRRYESAIVEIVSAYPLAVKIDHKDLSPSTYSARLRDAMTSLYDFNWPTTKVDIVKFRFNRNQIIVSHRPNGVFAGSSEGLKTLEVISEFAVSKLRVAPQNLPLSGELPIEEPYDLTDLDLHQVKLLCRLASARIVVRRCKVKIDEENREFFEQNFDVQLDKGEEGNVYILS